MPQPLSGRELVQIECFHEAGWTIARIAARLERPGDTVYRNVRRIEDGTFERRKAPGRAPRFTTEDVERIVARVQEDPFVTLKLLGELEGVSGTLMSRTLRKEGYFSCMATLVTGVKGINIVKRYMWAVWMTGLGEPAGVQHASSFLSWPLTPPAGIYDTQAVGVQPSLPGMPYNGLTWDKVVFTDETALRLGGTRHRRVLRKLGDGMLPQYHQNRTLRAPCLHVWGGVAVDVKLPLVALRLKQQNVSKRTAEGRQRADGRCLCRLGSSTLVLSLTTPPRAFSRPSTRPCTSTRSSRVCWALGSRHTASTWS